MSGEALHSQLDEIERIHGLYSPASLGLASALACGAFTFLLGGGPLEMILAFAGAGIGNAIRCKLGKHHFTLFMCIAVSVSSACLVYAGFLKLAELLFHISVQHEAGYICSFSAFPASLKAYDKNFKIGGVKLISDGSPQGRTAWMRTPYLNENGAPEKDGYCGYPSISESELVENVRFSKERGLQLLVHCNGDMAAEKFIRAQLACGDPATRPVMIHAQLLGVDQLDDLKRAGILPSFFVAHVLYWGDVHVKNFGFERASAISPLRSALKKGIRFTLHQDAPVVSPDMLETIWCAAERRTKSGKILGENERIGVLPALRAVTENAAYQYFEENTTGTLAAGKRENLVLLSGNPLRTPAEKLRDIVVERTIKDGETVFRR